MTIKKKIHHLISGQLPAFVRDEYPAFVTFLEHYYKFLEEPGEVHDALLNSSDWTDVDNTLDVFLPYYRAQFTHDIPIDTIVDNRRLLKYINQYYEGKGAENSTEMFFRFMFNDTASVAYPGDYTLRASDGRWSRKKIIKVETTKFTDEDIFELAGTEIVLRYLEYVAGAGSVERTVQTRCFDVYGTSRPFIYQLEVDINPDYVFPSTIIVDPDPAFPVSLGNRDSHIYVELDDTTYGTISKQLVSVASIPGRGSKFRRDDSYTVSETGVEGTYFAGEYTVVTTGSGAYVYDEIENNAIIRVTKTRNTASEQYFLSEYTVGNDYASAPTRGVLQNLSIIDTGEKFLSRDDAGDPVTQFTVQLRSTHSANVIKTNVLTGSLLTGVAITNTAGAFSCTSSTLTVGDIVSITGTFGGTGSITGYTTGTVYKISATNGTTTFTLVDTAQQYFFSDYTIGNDYASGDPLVTTVGTPTGLRYNKKAGAFDVINTTGSFLCADTAITVGDLVMVTGALTGSGTITGYATGTEYKVSAINSSLTHSTMAVGFTLVTPAGVEIATTPGTLVGLTFLRSYRARVLEQGSLASIVFNTGYVYHAPGEYKDNSGFLSDSVKVQDNHFYQPYSYVVRTTKALNTWKATYLASSHPAGFKMFAEVQLTDIIAADVTVTDILTQLLPTDLGYRHLTDTVTVTDTVSKSISSTLPTDTITTSDSVTTSITYSRDFSDTVTTTDSLYNSFLQADDASSDFQEDITLSDATELSTSMAYSDSYTVTDSLYIETTMGVGDTIITSDSPLLNIETVITDSLAITDGISISSDILVASDTVTSSDSLVAILVIPVDITDTLSVEDSTPVINTSNSITDSITIVDSPSGWVDSYFVNGRYSASPYVNGDYVGSVSF